MKPILRMVTILALAGSAWANPIIVSGQNGVRTISGGGQDIVIEGHHLEVVITGDSGRVTISGHHNQVVLEHPASIDASGHHNQIVYKSGNPAVTQDGKYNEIIHGQATNVAIPVTTQGAAGDTVQISGAGAVRTEEGNGRSFAIAGANNKVTIRGQANVVDVSGSGNVVTVEQANVINASGMGNQVFFSKGSPQMNRSGLNNEITHR
ncbi:DUF3060 domain-containing protein [bacterium]|nr:DUF3060 domain-containing protein [bacterium]